LNNYLATPGGGHALIDVTDVMFYRSALARGARLRTLWKLARHPEDAELVRRLGWLPLLEGYREALTSLGVTQSMAGIVPDDLLNPKVGSHLDIRHWDAVGPQMSNVEM
jgi:hypothetical protein